MQLDGSAGELTAESLAHNLDARRAGTQWMARCPAHSDDKPSLAIRDENGKVLLRCHAGCDQRDVIEALKARGMWESSSDQAERNIETAYSYTDQSGKVLYQVVRRPGKQFFQRRLANTGKWENGLAGVEPVPYRLPELIAAQTVFVVEGEKDADNLSRVGLVATCNNGGAGNFKPALVPYFVGKNVVILPDNDEPGRKHADRVAELLRPVAASLLVVALPGLPDKGDVSDYLASGKTQADIRALCRETLSAAPTEPETKGIRSIADLKPLSAYASQTIEMVVEGIQAAGTITLLSGDSGSGKTTITDSLAHAVANGIPFAGLATQKRPVIALDRENPLSIVLERRARIGVPETPDFVTWGGWCEDEACDVASPIITEWVAASSPKPVIIVDSFVAFARCDENSASDVRAFIQPLRRLADAGASIILLHHSGKGESSKEFRGSSDIKAAVDVAYHVANMGDPARLSIVRLRAFKARFAVIPEIILHYVEGVGFQMDNRGPSLTVTETLRNLLIRHPRIGAAEFGNAAVEKGIARAKARDFLANGIKIGTIKVENGAHNSRYHIWKGAEEDVDRAGWGID